MIQKLVDSNQSFASKTEFSKAKYIKRKMEKFSKLVIPLPPTAVQVLEMYRQKNIEKVREMRVDSLSQILTLGNIRPGSRVLLVDDTSGLVALSILERTGGKYVSLTQVLEI
jgi:tRNA (adenine-N(1)-)-methyltransferase non-catalytic subunit